MSDLAVHNKLATQIFRDAAKYIRTYGWQRKGMSEHGKPRCSMGALQSAYPMERWDQDMAVLMFATLYDELGGITLTQFNEKVKDGEEVAALYDHVADVLASAN